MSDLPATVRHPAAFSRSPSLGFDGAFHWQWMIDAFSDTKIQPMDFDGVVERNGQFIVAETKDRNKDIPDGQRLTLERAHSLGCFTILIVWGKEEPSSYEIWPAGKTAIERGVCDAPFLTERCRAWRAWAEKNPGTGASVDFLRRRVTTLQGLRDDVRRHVETLVSALGGSVTWGG